MRASGDIVAVTRAPGAPMRDLSSSFGRIVPWALARRRQLPKLSRAGIPVAEAEGSGQFELCRWEDAYLRDGHFDQNRMLALIEEVLQAGTQQGYPLTRLVANMEWALEDRPGVNDIVEYETRLNYILPKYDDAVC